MRVVVTGLSGNVGTALLRVLAAAHPDWPVTGVARRRPDPATPPYGQADWVARDLADPDAATALADVFAGAGAVVHLAWALQPSHDPQRMTSTNVEGSRHVFTAVREAGVPHLVYASSLGAYSPMSGGRHKPAIREDWPTGGVRSSLYSRHKATVERMLDEYEQQPGAPVVTRARPGLVLQRDAASEVSRYFLGTLAPLLALAPLLPVLPVPTDVYGSGVHADDLADALVRILERRPRGAFNIAAEPPLDAAAVARAFGARLLPVPFPIARAVTDLTWRLHVQPTDAGWLDIARASPILDATRARTELGWTPRHDPIEALAEVAAGLRGGAGTGGPVLAPR